jgi:metallo-beta-lactamase class B
MKLGMTIAVALSALVSSVALAKVAPYTEADITYGRTLQAKIDAARAVSTDPKISKAPIEPFRIVGDLYFAGVHNWGVYLVKTPKGVVMLDSGWDDTLPLLEASLVKLKIKWSDIKYILMTEAHRDHNGAIGTVKAKTGAQIWVMEGDEKAVESGSGMTPNASEKIPGAHVDRVLRDRDQLKFGGRTFTAYHIPGHTKGSTTWVWQEREAGKTYTVGDICCWFTPDNVVSNPDFSVATLRNNWAVLKSLSIDVPAPGIHTYHFDLIGKLARKAKGEAFPWLDPQGYRGVIAAFERDFEDKLAKQIKDGPPPPRAAPAPR